jgi:hypothetical protein
MRTNSWWWVALGASLGCIVYGAAQMPLVDGGEVVQASMFAPPPKPAKTPVFVP